ncbi:MAG: peptidoglycan bridge formation glycyltransferase FemA/FemB family protein [Thaumarchaeota archaeon]|nr:peptidoglycan bridge formation glycyltransferase FemA/FemB family protein [Nitrososphaerota archaeon]
MGSYLTSLGGPMWIPGEEKGVGEQLVQSMKDLRHHYLFVLIHTTPFFLVNLGDFGLKQLLPRGYSFVIDLKPDIDELWKKVEKRSRGAVNKAKKNGLRVHSAETFEDWEQYYHLQIAHSKRKKFENLAYDLKTLRGLYRLSLDSKCTLLLCLKDDKPLAAVLWFFSRKLMVLHRNAWSDEEKLNANNLLFWESLLWGKNHDYQAADLGGAPVPGPGVNRGIYDFKRSWGGARVFHNRYYQGRLYGLAFKLSQQVPGVRGLVRQVAQRIS